MVLLLSETFIIPVNVVRAYPLFFIVTSCLTPPDLDAAESSRANAYPISPMIVVTPNFSFFFSSIGQILKDAPQHWEFRL
jgi:hypothetical protein